MVYDNRQDNESIDHISELQKIADYLMIKKKLRWPGIGGIIFGGLILLGYILAAVDPRGPSALNLFDIVYFAFGLVLFSKGWRLLRSPRPSDLVIEGILLIIIAVFNIIWMIMVLPGPDDEVFIDVVPFFQLAWGIVTIAQYRRFKHASAAGADKELLSELKRIIKSVLKSSPKRNEDIIAFRSKTFLRFLKWKGRLKGPYGIFAEKKGEDALFLQKREISFEPLRKIKSHRKVKVRAILGPRILTAKISTRHLERFRRWKGSDQQSTGVGLPVE